MIFQDVDRETQHAMRHRIGHGRRLTPRVAVGALAVLALLAGAIPAVAATLARRPATIYACVTSKTGAIKIVSASAKCRAGQHKISWNSQGPRGPQGPPAMVTGYESTQSPGVAIGTSFTTVNSLTLPVGSFLLTAVVPLHDLGAGTDVCRLTDAGGDIGEVSVTVPLDPDGVGQGEITLIGATTTGGSISVQCLELVSTVQAEAFSRVLTAVPVLKVSS